MSPRARAFLDRITRGPRSSDAGPRFVYVSYHKCATQFVEKVIRAVCAANLLRAETFDSRHARVPRRALRRTDFLLLTDYSSGMLDLEALGARGLYVTRDPRDILVSMYYSHRFSHAPSHPEIERNRLVLEALDVHEGLRYLLRESGFFARIMHEMHDWSDRGLGYYETTFERITADAHREFEEAFSALGLAVERPFLDSILDENSFEKLQAEWARHRPDSTVNHYRRGRPEAWRTELIGDAASEFDRRYGKILSKLGYEPTTSG